MLNILIADPIENDLIVAKQELIDAGFTVDTSLNHENTLKIIKENYYFLVFIELLEIEKSHELCKSIKCINESIFVVLIATAANPNKVVIQMNKFLDNGGIEEYLRKPLIENDLVYVAQKLYNEYLNNLK